ncbi:hypothetical protein NLG97_g1153 [Lecanicillium saksenae]|uniref:Uncharacterized protein n=1 Tax=Lecanicillium saksenae TaxID=468837 RepID=A0ACC1R7Z0_9HYPO|nr:hypothetical protein NLG97_g1153 [Lecanicillium saksenae]
METALRSALLSKASQKIYCLGTNQAKSSFTLSLINDDIPIVCEHIQIYFQLFNDAIHVGLGTWLLWRLAGPACLLGITTVAVSAVVSMLLQRNLAKAQSEFTKASRSRSENIRSALSQLPLIKMLGLRSVVMDRLRTLRETEIKRLQAFSDIKHLLMAADIIVDIGFSSMLCFGFYFLTTERVIPEYIFPALALSVQLQIALYTGLRKVRLGNKFLEALKRVETFLLQQGFTDTRTVTDLGTIAVSCVETAIAPEGCEEPVLRNINFTINKSTVTACIGPSTSGKSSFLQGLAGQAKIAEGSMHVGNTHVAYCDQNPWLENISIRDNIVSGLEFDPVRYDMVLRLCLLHQDIRKLEEGDAYIAGVNGGNLSVGQRNRVSLARALYSRIPTIIIDDLFGSLDPKTATSILYLLCGRENGFLRRDNRTVFLSTYLVECFNVADQVLIFDGRGHAMMRNRNNVDSKFRAMLESLHSPHEVNPEEEDHKQLTAILRSRRIRATLDAGVHRPAHKRYEPISSIFAFNAAVSTKWGLFMVAGYNMAMCLSEIFAEYLTSIWVESHATDVRYPVFLTALCMATAFVAICRAWSTLAYLGAVDQSNLSQQMDSFFDLAQQLPMELTGTLYRAFVFLLHYFNRRSSQQLHQFKSKAEEKLAQKFTEAVDGIKYTRPFGWESNNISTLFELVDQSQRWHYVKLCERGSLLFLCDCHTALDLVILVFLATRRPLASSQSGIGLSFWSSLCLSHALEILASQFAQTETFLGNAHELQNSVRNIPIEDHDCGIEPPASWPDRGEVLFEHVTARYNTNKTANPALENISVSVGGGEKLAIAGRTGSGKTSLILALLGFLNYEGTIKIDGIDISTVNRDALRSRVVTLTYNPLQLRATVRRNLLPFGFQYFPSGSARVDDERVRDVLTDLGIWNTISRQGGLDAFLPNVQLSRSETQLFGIARAILQRDIRGGKLILMDEATSALDKATDRHVQGALTVAFPGCTFLIITHRQATVMDAQKFLELEDGRVRSFRDTRRIQDAEASETRVSYNQLAESAGGGTLADNTAA